jgi:tetratricopeptide (TPR) repeat protein
VGRQSIDHEKAAVRASPGHPEYLRILSHAAGGQFWTLFRLRDHAGAAKLVDEWREITSIRGLDTVTCAEIFAHCSVLAAKDDKLSPQHRTQLADSYIRRARGFLDEAARKNADDPETQNALAQMLAQSPDHRLRDPARAVEWAKKAVERSPPAAPYRSTLGLALYRAGEWSGFIESIGKALELRNGGEATDWFILAIVHWKRGDRDQGRRWYDKGVRWMEENDPKSYDLGRLRDEAAALMELTGAPMPNGADAVRKPDVEGQAVRSGAPRASAP